MQNAAYQLAIGFGLVLYAAASPCPFPTMAANAAEPKGSNRLIDTHPCSLMSARIGIGAPRTLAGLLVALLTLGILGDQAPTDRAVADQEPQVASCMSVVVAVSIFPSPLEPS